MVAHWSPLSQVERTPDRTTWHMFDGPTRIAVVRYLELGPRREGTFRVVTWAVRSEDRVLIGYFLSLRMAAEVTWAEYVQATKGVRVPPLLDVE